MRILFSSTFLIACAAFLTVPHLLYPASKKPINSFSFQNGFIENKGQVIDQDNKPNPAVLYLLNTPGMNVQLRKAGFSYDVYTVSSRQSAVSSRQSAVDSLYLASGIRHPASGIQHPAPSIQYHRIDFALLNSNPDCEIITSGLSSDYLNYYTTGTPVEGITHVHSYKSIIYKNIYPNIDLEFLVDYKQGFKYNFVVHPGGNLSSIQLKITDPEINLAPNGSLILKNTIGTVEESIPESYAISDGIKVSLNTRFIKTGENEYGISCNSGIPAFSKLVIDPTPIRIWGTYYGGFGDDGAWGCSTDASGNVFISGTTTSLTYIATAGSFQASYGGGFGDIFLAKFSSDGQLLWGTYYGGSSTDDNISTCPVDKEGNVYLCGRTTSTNNISTPGSFQPVTGGYEDGFLVKFNTNGQRLWGTFYGGSDVDRAYDCSPDDSCNVYLVGGTRSPNNIATPGAFQENYSGGLSDGFLAKFDSSGQRIWGTYYGGTGIEEIISVSSDTSGHIIFTGSTYSTDNISSPGAFQGNLAGAEDAFLVLFNANGQRIWGTYYGGENDEEPRRCKITNQNTILLYGSTISFNNISTPGSYQPSKSGMEDIFLVKFTLNCNRLWGTYFGGDSSDYGIMGLAVNDSNYIYIAGWTESQNNIATPGSFQSTYRGDFDSFIAKFSENGQRIWGTYFGDTLADYSGSLALDSCGIIYLSGGTHSDTNIATTGAHQVINNGGINWGDGFLVKFSDCHVPDSAKNITGPANVCRTTNNIIYTVPQISYATGYFWNVPPGITIVSGQNTNSIIVNIGITAISGNVAINGINCCGDGINSFLYITVHSRPVPTITGSDSACTGTSYVYTTNSGKSQYQWTISSGGTITGGGTGNDYTATVTWNSAGVQWISVNYTDTNGCTALTPALKNTWVTIGFPVSVSIISSADTVCQGDSVTFTAFPVNGGANPIYQWRMNGIIVWTNSPVFTYAPANGDTVICILSSSDTCTTNNPASSNQVIMVINSNLIVGVSIAASANPACKDTAVTFTATPVNGGSSPVYLWRVNGITAGTNSPVYTYTPANGDTVICVLTSSEICTLNNPVTSSPVIMVINSNLVVGVTIAVSVNPVCSGIPVTFTATPVNGGANPNYQWNVNGIIVGTNSPVYTYTPANGDEVICVLTSSESCTANNPVTSSPVIMVINQGPLVTFSKCNDTITTTNAKPFILKGGIPLGGTYSGPGVNSATGIFNPAAAGVGNNTITYTYTNSALCSAGATRIFRVVNASFAACGLPLVDVRDNQTYQTVSIGSQCWIAENLNYGTEIPDNLVQRDNCVPERYRNPTSSIQHPASVYQWDEIMQYSDTPGLQGLCPPAWHVPTEADWQTLFSIYNGPSFAASPLLYNGFSGFNALVNGSRFENSSWNFEDFAVHFWTSTSWGSLKAWAHAMNNMPDNHSVSSYPSSRSNAFSVRCIKD